MRSGLGRNLVACSENFNLSVPFVIHGGFSKALVSKIVHSRIPPSYYCRVLAALELIMLKRGVLHVNDFSLDFNAIDGFLRSVCIQSSFVRSFFPLFCTKCTILIINKSIYEHNTYHRRGRVLAD